MKSLKGWITTTFIIALIGISASSTNAGIIFGGSLNQSPSTPCTQVEGQKTSGQTSDGTIGSLLDGLVGIIFGGSVSYDNTECGIIFGGS